VRAEGDREKVKKVKMETDKTGAAEKEHTFGVRGGKI